MNYRTWIVALALMCRAATVHADEPQAPSQIENRVCTFQQQNDFYTVGIDFRKYAETDYDLDVMVSDFTVIAARNSRYQ